MTDTGRDAVTRFLVDRGATMIRLHHRTLLAHLAGTEELLRRWNCPDEIAIAGLCHAAYGTDGLVSPLVELDGRSTLRALIGDRAEAHVYRYGCCDRRVVYPQLGGGEVRWRDRFDGREWAVGEDDVSAFVLLTWANALEAAAAGTDADWSAVRYLLAMTAHLVGPLPHRSAETVLGLDLGELTT